MSINSAMSPIPYKGIPGFDNIASDVVGIIAEYAGCISGPEDQPSWSVDRQHECLRILFAPRLHPVRLSHTAHWNNELNKEYAIYQNYKRIENLWKMSKWLLSNDYLLSEVNDQDLHNIANDRTFYSLPTFRQHWFAYLGSLHQAFVDNTPPRHLAHLSHAISSADENALLELGRANLQTPSSDPDPRILDIQSACRVLDQTNNVVAEAVFPMQCLRAIVQSTQESFYADIASCEAQRVQSASNVQSRSIFMKALACAVAVCLIARRILTQIVPVPILLGKGVLKGLGYALLARGTIESLICGPRVGFLKAACSIASRTHLYFAIHVLFFHLLFHKNVISQIGLELTLEHRKRNFQVMMTHIQTIWHSRELITDVYIKGVFAHASMAMESIRKLGPMKGLRHGYLVLSRIAREGLA